MRRRVIMRSTDFYASWKIMRRRIIIRRRIIMRSRIIMRRRDSPSSSLIEFIPRSKHLDLKIRLSQLRLVTTFIIFLFIFFFFFFN